MIRLNPVFMKEIKLTTRSFRMAFTIMLFNAILASIGLIFLHMNFRTQSYYYRSFNDFTNIYIALAIVQFILVLFLIPAFTAGTISGERERQTLEILLSTKMKPWSIIFGKLSSSLSLMLLLIFSSMPILGIMFSFGGIRMGQLVGLISYLFVTAVFIGSIGMFYSTVFKKTTMATVFTYGTILLLTLGTLFISVIIGILMNEISVIQYMLLLNPGVGFAAVLLEQLGGSNVLTMFFGYSTTGLNSFVAENWLGLNCLLEILIAGLLLFIATKRLNPIKANVK